jgi:hypothetical protein
MWQYADANVHENGCGKYSGSDLKNTKNKYGTKI